MVSHWKINKEITSAAHLNCLVRMTHNVGSKPMVFPLDFLETFDQHLA
jgi:hypothetical protein